MHENHFLFLDDMLVGNAVLLIVHVLALNGALLLIQGTVTVEPDVEVGVGAVGTTGVHVQVPIGCADGLGLGIRGAFAFTI